MTAYYNEHDPFAAAWLRELVKAGHIAPGEVDTRSIEDVAPADLVGFTQCHFFAGIGGWSRALRLAGWPDDRPVWTGSCPCQPFSAAGKRAGFADERHLWPAWHWLIAQRRPGCILGEQVARGGGPQWLDLVANDLEALGYAVGAVNLCAVGSPQIRQRFYWVGCTDCGRPQAQPETLFGKKGREKRRAALQPSFALAWAASDDLACNDGTARPVEPGTFPLAHGVSARVGRLRGYGNAINAEAAAAFISAASETIGDLGP